MAQRMQGLVIGGGAIGVKFAHALAEAGRDVVLIDKDAICSGCSHGNVGWVSSSHLLPIAGPGVVKQIFKWMLHRDSPLYIRPTLESSMLRWLW